MRKTCVKGLNDGLNLDLGREVEIICAVMEIGKAVDAITFEIKLSGKELIEFLKENKLSSFITDEIILDNEYLITAYDW